MSTIIAAFAHYKTGSIRNVKYELKRLLENKSKQNHKVLSNFYLTTRKIVSLEIKYREQGKSSSKRYTLRSKYVTVSTLRKTLKMDSIKQSFGQSSGHLHSLSHHSSSSRGSNSFLKWIILIAVLYWYVTRST